MIYSYRRVSTDEQHNGPEAQYDAIERWRATKEASPSILMDFFDNGVSGSVPLGQRPAGVQLLASIKPDDTVVTAKLDRLFRSVADAATTINDWCKRGVTLVAIAEGFDMTNPYGKAMAQMASVFAELEREMIRSRTKAALAAKKARGECVGEVPYGWYKDPVSGMLLTNQTEQQIIRNIVEMSAYMTPKEIAMALNDAYHPAKKGGKWGKTQVQRVIDRAERWSGNG
jgi:putative DNA-invertase from lambdoid prophage Rac